MNVSDDGNGHYKVEAQIPKRRAWIPVSGAAVFGAMFAVGVETFAQDLANLVKGAEAAEVRMGQVEKRLNDHDRMIEKLTDTVVVLGQTTARLTAVMERQVLLNKEGGR